MDGYGFRLKEHSQDGITYEVWTKRVPDRVVVTTFITKIDGKDLAEPTKSFSRIEYDSSNTLSER